MRSKVFKGSTLLLSCALVGCAANSPAPVSSLNKNYSSIDRGSYRGSYYEVKKGDTVVVQEQMWMNDFASKTLNRTFDELLFVGRIDKK